ncbi:ATP-binding protein [Veillonella atypica]|uniref:ATP-binding protein n=1 Tax=Veillonella atypica TaxID=39777 RepID=UPI00244AEF21|nr:ATP-binding protein [Veillonella atypica]
MKALVTDEAPILLNGHDLIQNLKSAKDEGRLETRLKHYARSNYSSLMKLGYFPVQPGDANLLFQIIDRRYEKKSTIVTSNINFDEWATILHDERVANAIVIDTPPCTCD